MNISEIGSHMTSQPAQDQTDVSFQVMPQEGNLDPAASQQPPAPQPVKTPASPPPPTTSIPTDGAPEENKPSFWHSTLFKVIIGLVLLAVALGAGAYFMLKNKKTVSVTPPPVDTSSTRQLSNLWLTKYFNSSTCSDQTQCGVDADPDKDGLKNYDEFKASTSPINPDTDADGLADGDEVNIYKTEPTLKYTDRRDIVAQNGWSDGAQIKGGFDPLTPGLQLTDARKLQIADDTIKFTLHEPTITTLKAVIVDITASWQTYTNDKYGLQFSFPNSYTVNNNSSTNVGPLISSTYADLEVRDYQVSNLSGGQAITVGGVAATKYPVGGNIDKGIEYQIDIPSKKLTVFFNGKNPDSSKYIAEYDQILSTFKFTK